MSENGLISVLQVKISDLCCDPQRYSSNGENQFEFAIRWEDGEISENALALETDGFYDGNEKLEFEGTEYVIRFGEEVLTEVLADVAQIEERARPPEPVALRYFVEFDAFLRPGGFQVGGNWEWGDRGGRDVKRTPTEFYESWRQQ